MSNQAVHPIEDDFHRMQVPGPIAGVGTGPYVGNASVDENVAECVRAALWDLGTKLHDRLHVDVADGYVAIAGTVDTAQERGAVEGRVFGVDGISGITNLIEIAENNPTADTVPNRAPRTTSSRALRKPMLYVTRFCSLEPASITAAIRQGVDALDSFFSKSHQPLPKEVIVIYRNRLRETVIVEVGVPVSEEFANQANGEIHRGWTPSSASVSMVPTTGLEGVLAAHDRLLERARLTDVSPARAIWQRFPLDRPRLSADWPAARVHLAVDAIP